MAFTDNFDAIKEYAANAAQAAAKKTKKLAAIAKANIAILAEEDKVKKAQLELGKVYYKDFILNEEPDQAEYLPWCDKITESLKLIDNLKMEIEMARQPDTAEEVEKDVDVEDIVDEAEAVVDEAEAVVEEVKAVIENVEETTDNAVEAEIPQIVVVEETPEVVDVPVVEVPVEEVAVEESTAVEDLDKEEPVQE